MSFRERSAWLTAAILVVAYGWYVVSVVEQLDGGSVVGVGYQSTAVVAMIGAVVAVGVTHALLAVTGRTGSRNAEAGAAAVRRYARSSGGSVVTAAAVIGMSLSMFEVDHFWIANVILAGLVLAEMVASGSEILLYQRGA